MNELSYIDLFSGIGGFHLGLLQAGFKFSWTGFSEIDKYAKKVYQNHFQESEDLGDVRQINAGELISRVGHINLITFGFPCQDLSVAGKQQGLHGKRSGLFFEAMRIVEAAKPDIFIFENVKGLLSSNGGRDFTAVLRRIADIGLYECEWQLVNTSWLLPQNRERVYFIGHLRGTGGCKVFPIREGDCGLTQAHGETQGEGQRVPSHYPSLRVGGGNNKALISTTLQGRDYKGGNNLVMVHGGVMRKGEFGTGIKEDLSFTMDSTCGRDLLICQK